MPIRHHLADDCMPDVLREGNALWSWAQVKQSQAVPERPAKRQWCGNIADKQPSRTAWHNGNRRCALTTLRTYAIWSTLNCGRCLINSVNDVNMNGGSAFLKCSSFLCSASDASSCCSSLGEPTKQTHSGQGQMGSSGKPQYHWDPRWGSRRPETCQVPAYREISNQKSLAGPPHWTAGRRGRELDGTGSYCEKLAI